MSKFKHASLFSGIGGPDLAAEWMGWENIFHCEKEEFAQAILKYYWPNAELFKNIKDSCFKKYANQIDVLTGGFPCQPYSNAGKRLGTEDERHLWPEMLRAIREIQPRWVVGENVRGLTNWNGGMVFDQVQADLEIAGYEVLPFLLPACSVNAPHRRDRIFFVAHRANARLEGLQSRGQKPIHESQPITNATSKQGERIEFREQPKACGEEQKQFGGSDCKDDVANTERNRGIQVYNSIQRELPNGYSFNASDEQNNWQEFPTQSPICSGDDGLPSELDGITFSKWRAESVKAFGNAIVPQLILQIFKAIEQYESLKIKQLAG